jgi:23S rRNA (cytidine1920-2'-O)/16S rRNA (cytidine1409-2'-O)-methyltransferase
MIRRLDAALVHRGLAKSRTAAQDLIENANVFINGIVVIKSSVQVSDDIKIEIRNNVSSDVSRGATKLRNALAKFSTLDPSDKICLDVGASTGGFTQVLLEAGAKKVYALDVGYGQLDWSLRQNKKVVVLERFNARNLSKSDISDEIDIIVADVSFISLTLLLPSLQNVLKPNGEMILMVKPQFELQREEISTGGVVMDLKLREKAVWKVIAAATSNGLNCSAISYSGLPGPSGNKEFFIRLRRDGESISQLAVRDEIERAGI